MHLGNEDLKRYVGADGARFCIYHERWEVCPGQGWQRMDAVMIRARLREHIRRRQVNEENVGTGHWQWPPSQYERPETSWALQAHLCGHSTLQLLLLHSMAQE